MSLFVPYTSLYGLEHFPVTNIKIVGGLLILPQEYSSCTALNISQLVDHLV